MSGPITPYKGKSSDRLVALINAANLGQFVDGQPYAPLANDGSFTFGQPMAYVDSDGRNTEISLTFERADYQKTDYVQYSRLALTVLNDLPDGYLDMVVIPTLPFKLSDILDRINDALGLDLDISEIRDQTFTSVQTRYPLPINAANSVAWIDSDFTFLAGFPIGQAVDGEIGMHLVYAKPAPSTTTS